MFCLFALPHMCTPPLRRAEDGAPGHAGGVSDFSHTMCTVQFSSSAGAGSRDSLTLRSLARPAPRWEARSMGCTNEG